MIKARPYSDRPIPRGHGPRPIRAIVKPVYVESKPKPAIDVKVDTVLAQLPAGLEYVQPKHVAPLLGITQNGFTWHLRECPKTCNWDRGNYRFYLDDPEHVAMLRSVIKMVLQSGRKLPSQLRSH